MTKFGHKNHLVQNGEDVQVSGLTFCIKSHCVNVERWQAKYSDYAEIQVSITVRI